MRIEFIIIIALAVGATFFVVVVAIGLLINKFVEARQSKGKQALLEWYSGLFAELVLEPLPEMTQQARLYRYEEMIEPVKSGLSWSAPPKKKAHREAIKKVLLDFANDVVGEPMDRLLFFFESFGFVDDELRMMKSPLWWVRARAARDLGLLHAKRAIGALTTALQDEHPDVRNAAIQSLIKIAGVDALRTILRSARTMSLWTTMELSVIVKEFEEAACPYLLEALAYEDQSVVLFSIEMLSEIGFVSAVEPLMELTKRYPNITVRAKAAEALGRLGDQRAEELLHELLKNPYAVLRASATKALERIGSPGSIPLLKDRLSKGPLAERISAARALATSGEAGLEELRSMSMGTDDTLSGIALHVLEEVEGPPEES